MRNITLYASDVSRALVDSSLTVESCLKSQVENLQEVYPKLLKRNEELMKTAKAPTSQSDA